MRSTKMKFGQLYPNGKAQTDKSATPFLRFDAGDKHAWYDWSKSFALDSIGTYNIYNTKYNGGSPIMATLLRPLEEFERKGQ